MLFSLSSCNIISTVYNVYDKYSKLKCVFIELVKQNPWKLAETTFFEFKITFEFVGDGVKLGYFVVKITGGQNNCFLVTKSVFNG